MARPRQRTHGGKGDAPQATVPFRGPKGRDGGRRVSNWRRSSHDRRPPGEPARAKGRPLTICGQHQARPTRSAQADLGWRKRRRRLPSTTLRDHQPADMNNRPVVNRLRGRGSDGRAIGECRPGNEIASTATGGDRTQGGAPTQHGLRQKAEMKTSGVAADAVEPAQRPAGRVVVNDRKPSGREKRPPGRRTRHRRQHERRRTARG